MLPLGAQSATAEPPRSVRLPRTTHSRNATTYIRLLQTVTADSVWGGFAFNGNLLRPGAVVDERTLRPDDSWPETPVLLECAGSSGGRGHRRAPTVYILWRYLPARGDWLEIARAAAVGRDWTGDLGPIARAELKQHLVRLDPVAAADRVMRALEAELEPLDRPARKLVMLEVYDRFASRVSGGAA